MVEFRVTMQEPDVKDFHFRTFNLDYWIRYIHDSLLFGGTVNITNNERYPWENR